MRLNSGHWKVGQGYERKTKRISKIQKPIYKNENGLKLTKAIEARLNQKSRPVETGRHRYRNHF